MRSDLFNHLYSPDKDSQPGKSNQMRSKQLKDLISLHKLSAHDCSPKCLFHIQMTANLPEGWFDQNPDKKEHQEMREAMIAYFARNPLADKRPEDLVPTLLDIIDGLAASQPFWEKATPRQLTLKKKRYLSLYDLVRRAYDDRPKTEQAISNFILEQDVAYKAAKDKAIAQARDKAQEANIESEDGTDS